MKIKCNSTLIQLAKIFAKRCDLFVVGGYVRNSLMGFCDTDTDIASTLTIEEVFSLLENSPFIVKLKSAKMGTVEIFKGNESFEHTTFRNEIYEIGGNHCPSSVEFGATIRQDAKRRDFSVNSIYYNILKDQIVDFYNGQNDIKNKLIRCVENPEYVFKNDGLRLLRMIRQSAEVDFEIEENTKLSAIAFASNLKAISGERKLKELELILNADKKYKSLKTKSPLLALEKITAFGFWKYILKTKNIKVNFNNFSFPLITKCNATNLKLTAFFIDLYRFISQNNSLTIKTYVSEILVNSFRISNKQQAYYIKLLSGFMAYSNQNDLKLYCYKNIEIIDDLMLLLNLENQNAKENIENTLKIFKETNTPLTIKQLKINTVDILNKYPTFNKNDFNKIFNKLLSICVLRPECNKKETLLEMIAKI